MGHAKRNDQFPSYAHSVGWPTQAPNRRLMGAGPHIALESPCIAAKWAAPLVAVFRRVGTTDQRFLFCREQLMYLNYAILNRRLAATITPCVAALLAITMLCSCGGGGGSGSGSSSTPPSTPDFSLSATPASIQIAPGSSQNLTVSIAAVGGFSGQAKVSVSGLSSGVTASPATFTLSPGSTQQVALAAQSSAPAASVTATVQAASKQLNHSVQVPLSVQTTTSSMQAPLRTRYLREDSYYDTDFEGAPPHFTAYDQPLRRFFVSNTFMNRIDVFDAAQEYQIASIVVPSGGLAHTSL
jgi:hypothetical protein